jgi:hypothetical protein
MISAADKTLISKINADFEFKPLDVDKSNFWVSLINYLTNPEIEIKDWKMSGRTRTLLGASTAKYLVLRNGNNYSQSAEKYLPSSLFVKRNGGGRRLALNSEIEKLSGVKVLSEVLPGFAETLRKALNKLARVKGREQNLPDFTIPTSIIISSLSKKKTYKKKINGRMVDAQKSIKLNKPSNCAEFLSTEKPVIAKYFDEPWLELKKLIIVNKEGISPAYVTDFCIEFKRINTDMFENYSKIRKFLRMRRDDITKLFPAERGRRVDYRISFSRLSDLRTMNAKDLDDLWSSTRSFYPRTFCSLLKLTEEVTPMVSFENLFFPVSKHYEEEARNPMWFEHLVELRQSLGIRSNTPLKEETLNDENSSHVK